jgi:NAD(P)H-hydrate epimerase
LIHLLVRVKQPLVLDADALNLIALSDTIKNRLPSGCILTPHPKEFDRLFGNSVSMEERVDKALAFANKTGCYVVLKKANTVICAPGGKYSVNPTGNPGMATAGSGDVLTGMILALLAQGYASWEAARLGVYLHGMAGDIAAGKYSQESMIASDLINCIGDAFLSIRDNANE